MNAKTKLETAARMPDRELFSLNGRYTIAPETTAANMLNDVGCLLESVDTVIEAVIDGLEDEGGQMIVDAHRMVPRMLYGVRYQLEMVRNMVNASFPRVDRTNTAGPAS